MGFYLVLAYPWLFPDHLLGTTVLGSMGNQPDKFGYYQMVIKLKTATSWMDPALTDKNDRVSGELRFLIYGSQI